MGRVGRKIKRGGGEKKEKKCYATNSDRNGNRNA